MDNSTHWSFGNVSIFHCMRFQVIVVWWVHKYTVVFRRSRATLLEKKSRRKCEIWGQCPTDFDLHNTCNALNDYCNHKKRAASQSLAVFWRKTPILGMKNPHSHRSKLNLFHQIILCFLATTDSFSPTVKKEWMNDLIIIILPKGVKSALDLHEKSIRCYWKKRRKFDETTTTIPSIFPCVCRKRFVTCTHTYGGLKNAPHFG